jgi:hypothetical protein
LDSDLTDNIRGINADPPIIAPDDDGIRPAGPGNACFYCRRKIGERHSTTCVTWVRAVKIRAIVEFDSDEPVSFTKRDIEERYNEGSFCASTILGWMEAMADESDRGCLCGIVRFEVEEMSPDGEP